MNFLTAREGVSSRTPSVKYKGLSSGSAFKMIGRHTGACAWRLVTVDWAESVGVSVGVGGCGGIGVAEVKGRILIKPSVISDVCKIIILSVRTEINNNLK